MDKHLPGGPLITSRRGFFWVGRERTRQPFGTVSRGPMFVTWEAPADIRHPLPVVLIHGGGGQGTDWLGTPDGRPGWASYLVEEGFVVYVVDRPGHGRSPLPPEVLGAMAPPLSYEACRWLFTTPPEGSAPASQFPEDGDEVTLDQFMASQGPMIADTAVAHALEQDRGAELLDRVGPAIVVTHSAGGPMGWLMADARPDLVRALVAVEPLGPPFLDNPAAGFSLPWGLTATPLTFDPPLSEPPVSEPDTTAVVVGQPRATDIRTAVSQANPPRLVNLAEVPIALVTAEASQVAAADDLTERFLTRAGCEVERLRLADRGLRGNSHAMMIDRNNREVLDVLLDWLRACDVTSAEAPVPAKG